MHHVRNACLFATGLGLVIALGGCDFDTTGVGLPRYGGDAAVSDPTTAGGADGSAHDAVGATVDDSSTGDPPGAPATAEGGSAPPPVTICHTRPPHKDITIVVDSAEVASHLAHGDHLGPCEQAPDEEVDDEEVDD